MSMKSMEYASVQSPGGIESTGPKMGHKCCGGCCDMRRAVIICDIILLVGGVLSLCFEGIGAYGASAVANMSFDDDAFASFGDDATADIFQGGLDGSQALMKQAEDLLLGLMVITSITLATTGASIWGAINYNYWPVAANTICLGVRAILPFLMGAPSIMGAAITALWIYPHVVFCLEVRSGVLCRETYGREQFSCCCIAERVLVSAPGIAVAEAGIPVEAEVV
eukprot:CAMPEP_0201866708 /NCGR_PEP_ID=MMETSP0902-20130614/1187_1 /ASSEMBLY_ACC=CAM_ASM_000551 /TAXON_ID=420261 /ORGANISM="Thalassiosira antarctica, Strain CCMP982" /LENGTH=223 /DNA_ID=CAMNT_0048391729 /DNA_START=98 /DNA_END=769 /DNA_ORIENTATION=+